MAAQDPVGLGTAESFAVLAYSGITNTGPTTITGDVGSFPTFSDDDFDTVTLHGTNHGADEVTQGAKDDLTTAYNDAAGRGPAEDPGVELGGQVLYAGVYRSGYFGLTGTLTLDAQGRSDAVFIFQAGSTVIAETYSRVRLINGANPCNVVWQVGSSATFKVGTRFVGDVLAHTSITAQTGAVFDGRLLARGGAVTLDTNTISNAECDTPEQGSPTTTTTAAPTPTTAGPTATTSIGATTTTTGTATTIAGITGTTNPGTTGTTNPGTTGTTNRHSTGTTTISTTGTTNPGATATTSLSRFGGGPDRPSRGTPRTPSSPPASPGAPSNPPGAPGTPSSPPFLPFTGIQLVGLLAAGLGLVGGGGVALVAGRRKRASLDA